MYERFYNLRERPFALSPDPEYLYLSRVHREALDSIRYGIESRAGFIVITGEIGAGKTTLLQTLMHRLDDRTIVARIVNTTLEPRELLEAIALDFGLEVTGLSKPALLRDLGHFLVQQRTRGRRPLVMIDEAQNLSIQALEEVRLLSNLETEESKLLQILLVGQPNLRDTIASPAVEQFRQRVAVSYHLTPLDAPETAAYINTRLERAAVGTPLRFPPDVTALVHQASRGLPRIINVVCDAALVFGYAEERRQIDVPLICEVIRELETTGILPMTPGAPVASSTGSETSAPAAEVSTRLALDADVTAALPLSTQAPAIARAAEEAAQQSARLAEREQALRQRERQLGEQRRVLAEEYRLLHTQRMHAAAARSRSRDARARGRRELFSGHLGPSRDEGFLAWLKRIFLGTSERALEEG
jgi:general secretion pathway protein A